MALRNSERIWVSSINADKRVSRKLSRLPGSSLVARNGEFAVILDHIAKRKSLHIYGEEGVGKSALLDAVYDFLKNQAAPIPIYCRSSRTLRSILLCLSLFLLDHFKNLESIDKFKRAKEIRGGSDIKKLGIRMLRNLVYSYLPQGDFCVILDHLEYVTPRINGFLTILYEKATVITASRQSWNIEDYSFAGRLDYCLYLIPKLKLEYLKRKDAFVLMEILGSKWELGLSTKRKMFDEVFRISKGNPRIITEIFEKAQRPEYHKDTVVNLGLIMIDSKIEELSEP